MIPLNKINDHDKVLPVKWLPMKHLSNGDPRCEGVNATIDQYNQVMIDGDVERLARAMYIRDNNDCSWEATTNNVRMSYVSSANKIISDFDKFLVLKKRLIEK